MNFQNTNCSDSRDKVCALRSLAKDEKAPWIGVEYSESLEEIWADLCRTYPEEFLLSGGWGAFCRRGEPHVDGTDQDGSKM